MMAEARIRRNSRALILEAAETIVNQAGVGAVTMDAVALATGIGKGGVLYHFPFKAHLLEALLDRQLGFYRDKLAELAPRGACSWLEWYIDHGLSGPHSIDRAAIEVFAATASDGPAHAPTRHYFHDRLQLLVAGCEHPAYAAVVMLAIDGLISNMTQNAAPIDNLLRVPVRAALQHLVELAGRKNADARSAR